MPMLRSKPESVLVEISVRLKAGISKRMEAVEDAKIQRCGEALIFYSAEVGFRYSRLQF
jgi:hypothetical protein